MLTSDEEVPDHERRLHIRTLAWRVRPTMFIETGTSEGDTVQEVVGVIPQIVSIELDYPKHIQAQMRYLYEPSVKLIRGDSGLALEQVVQTIKPEEEVLFWLDAHYNGGVRGRESVPVMTELTHILHHRRDQLNYILIDDARLFGKEPGYPTLNEVHYFVRETWSINSEMYVEQDILHVMPGGYVR